MFVKHLSVYLHVSEICFYISDQVLFYGQLYNLVSTVCNACPLLFDYVKVVSVSVSPLILKVFTIILSFKVPFHISEITGQSFLTGTFGERYIPSIVQSS